MLFSQIDYKISKSIISFTGSHPFHDWTGISNELKLEKKCSQKNTFCKYIFSIPWTSFNSGNDNRDNNMLYYVNAYEYQNIKFTFDNIDLNKLGNGSHLLTGILEIAKNKNQLSIPIKLNILDKKIYITSEFEISIKDFNIEQPTLLMIPINEIINIKIDISGEIITN